MKKNQISKFRNQKCVIIILSIILNFAFLILNPYAQDRGPLVSIELRDVELRDVMRALGQEHGINIIVDEKVTGKVTVSLRNVPLWDAIDSILKGKGYAYIREDSIVRIVPADDEDLVTRTISVQYANPKDLEPVIKKVLSKKGDVVSDPRSNILVIKDVPSAIERAEQLLKTIDIKSGQVMIEAKIVEVNTNAKKEFGIQWGAQYQNGDFSVLGGGNVTTTTASTTGGASTATTAPLTGASGPSNVPFNVNLPAAVGSGSGGAIAIGVLSGKLTLDLLLSALEDEGSAKILSSPKVMVVDNQEATIASGTQILIPTTTITAGSTATTGVTEKEATLRLTVTPKVIGGGQVSLKIVTKREEFDFSRAVLGIPPKNSREAQTGVIVKNGETIVIGGIYTEADSEGKSGVPFLSKIPILGWLFKKESTRKDRTELLIFITPRVVTD